MHDFIEFSSEVHQAIQHQLPILALESTIITHGLPQPINLQTALALENIVKKEGAVPATIACMNGKIKIGLSLEELTHLAMYDNPFKASRRDLPFVLSQKKMAGTTVAATLYCAKMAGIKVFATGGIGGVHRGDMLDISADLIELSNTSLAVICAGAKAILDIPRTLEFLETHSVPIIGFRTAYFPEFYSTTTTYPLTSHVNSVAELADVLNLHLKLNSKAGMLIANSPPEATALSYQFISPLIEKVIEKSILEKVHGKALTPFLLAEIAKVTKGSSIEANIALIKNNVSLGAKLVHSIL